MDVLKNVRYFTGCLTNCASDLRVQQFYSYQDPFTISPCQLSLHFANRATQRQLRDRKHGVRTNFAAYYTHETVKNTYELYLRLQVLSHSSRVANLFFESSFSQYLERSHVFDVMLQKYLTWVPLVCFTAGLRHFRVGFSRLFKPKEKQIAISLVPIKAELTRINTKDKTSPSLYHRELKSSAL